MGRRSAAGNGKRPGAQARPVRLLPAAGRADRLLLRQRHLPAALLAVNRSAVYGVGLARAVYLLRGAGDHRSVRARLAARNAGLRQSGSGEKTGQNPAGYPVDQTRPRDGAGHLHHAGNLYPVLHHDRLLDDLQHRRRAEWPGPAA